MSDSTTLVQKEVSIISPGVSLARFYTPPAKTSNNYPGTNLRRVSNRNREPRLISFNSQILVGARRPDENSKTMLQAYSNSQEVTYPASVIDFNPT